MPIKSSSLNEYLKTLTLLCADSTDITNIIYQDIFGILFKEVFFAKTAEKALEIYRESQIDLIITDQIFPKMSGMDMVKEIRKNNKSIPIILSCQFENINLLTEALHNNVHNFVKKPFEISDLLESIENAARQLLADQFLKEKQEEELNKLQVKIDYSNYQELLAFQKELKIIQNDFYYKHMPSSDNNSLNILDFLYRPKDVISGDSYSARKISEHQTLFFLADGMGKGTAASFTAMMSITFINRIIDNILKKNRKLDLKNLISKGIEDIRKTLLDEEIISCTFILWDTKEDFLEYASFSMPPILIMNDEDEIIRLDSNNLPINSYANLFTTDKIKSNNIKKLLLYSDGLIENSIKNEDSTYAQYLEEDFKNSITREDLRQKTIEKIDFQEDDITFIFINKISLKNCIGSLSIKSRLSKIEEAGNWFEKMISDICTNNKIKSNIELTFNELLLNAYEHGNLKITSKQKHKLVENDTYFDYLGENENKCKKNININLFSYENLKKQKYLIVVIEDGGKGFDTSLLSNIFGLNRNYNQRGIYMSKKVCLGLYYNDIANQVTFISKI